MRVLNKELPSADYKDFIYQNLNIGDIKKGFSQSCINFYEQSVPLWRELRTLLENVGISPKTITAANGVLVEGTEITSLVLSEALEYFCRAFYNFYAQDELVQHGYSTWSGVTNYYTSFFGIHSLLRLQGRCITSIWRPKGKRFHIFPYDFLQHQYIICTTGVERKTAHDSTWSIYYDVYNGFTYSDNLHFESIFKTKYVETVDEEMDFRNQINYEPYQGYKEIRDPELIAKFIQQYAEKKFTNNEIELLSRLTTDPDYRYYARSILRLIFAYTILSDIADENGDLDSLLGNTKNTLSSFLRQVEPRDEEDMISRRLQTLMGLEGFSSRA